MTRVKMDIENTMIPEYVSKGLYGRESSMVEKDICSCKMMQRDSHTRQSQ